MFTIVHIAVPARGLDCLPTCTVQSTLDLQGYVQSQNCCVRGQGAMSETRISRAGRTAPLSRSLTGLVSAAGHVTFFEFALARSFHQRSFQESQEISSFVHMPQIPRLHAECRHSGPQLRESRSHRTHSTSSACPEVVAVRKYFWTGCLTYRLLYHANTDTRKVYYD